ncbi:MAG: hypothetical protein SR1Q7_07680, partial [Quinella sp. 1Q7]|nr:hypothetical protein [Quinella sp. 1Q7]
TGENITWVAEADDESEGGSEGSESESESEGGSEGSESESEGGSEGSESESEGGSEGSESESEGGSEGSESESEGGSEAKSESSAEDIIDKNASADDIEKALGLATNHANLDGNSADSWWSADKLNISGNSIAGASAADLNQPLEVWLSNTDVTTTQTFDVSKNSGVKKVHLKAGAQDVALNPAVSGNFVEVTVGADGNKNITLGGGDAVLVDMAAGDGKVNVVGGAGDDSVVVRDGAPVTFDMSKGGKDILLTFAAANAHISLEGYNASTGAAIQVEEQGASVIADAVRNSLIGFDDGTVVIQSDDGKSKVYLGESDSNGWMVNLKTPNKESDTVQAVGFTGKDGGTVDGSEFNNVLFVGNMDGTKRAGSSLYGSAGNDTFFGGAGDSIVTGDGKDLVELQADTNRDGADINVSKGRVTIVGSNNVLGGFTGDTISIDDLDITTTKFKYAGDSLIIKDETLGFHAVVTAVSSLEGGYMTQYIRNTTDDTVYSVAIGGESSTIYVAEDDEARANAYIGNNSELNFTRYTKDAFIDLGNDWAESYINGERVYIEGVNQLVGGEGTTVFKGSDAKETLIAGKGNTSLYGAGGLNVLGGYSGTDKEGSTTFFVIGGNDGAVHTINNFEYVESNNYVNALNVTADQIETRIEENHFSNVAVVGDDLLLEVTSNYTGETEKALLTDAIDTVSGYGKDFAVNGLVAQVGDTKVNVDGTADYYLATETNATVNVASSLTGDAIIWLGDDGRDMTFEGDFAVIDASNFTGKAELAGNDLDNVIYAGTGATSLWGGNGGNDLLVGGAGADNFYYAAGNGSDTIDNAGGNDVVNFVNLTLADITIDTITSSAVAFNFSDGGKLTVNDNGSGVSFKVDGATYGINGNREFEQK